jgi:FKBP-type peptidyl-prolyl cis-trans isomerase (trigger factor)
MPEDLKFEDLKGEAKEFIIRGKSVRIPPLEVRDLDLFLKVSDPDKGVDALKEIFLRTMKRIFPERSEEEILSLPANVLLEFIVYILKANGLEVKEEVFRKVLEGFQSES